MKVYYEVGFNETIVQGLVDIGHNVSTAYAPIGFVVVTAISRDGDELTPIFYSQRNGSTFVF